MWLNVILHITEHSLQHTILLHIIEIYNIFNGISYI